MTISSHLTSLLSETQVREIVFWSKKTIESFRLQRACLYGKLSPMALIDPVKLFSSLTHEGTKPDCIMLESADIKTRKGEKSILMPKAALRAVCRGFKVELEALTEFGEKKKQEILKQTSLSFTRADKSKSLEEQLKHPSPMDVLRVMSKLEDIKMTLGVFAYDYVDLIEELPKAKKDLFNFPDYIFWLPESLIIIDHIKSQIRVWERGAEKLDERHCERSEAISSSMNEQIAASTTSPRNDGPAVDISDQDYAQTVKNLKTNIINGDVFQIVPSRTFSAPCENPFESYSRLKQKNPSPYMFYLNSPDFTLFGSSPETSVKVTGNPKVVEICPIAGTRARGVDLDHDNRKEAELKLDRKEQAEHMMLVDLARNDVARVSKTGTRHVSDLLTVDRYSTVMHLVSNVQGELQDGLDALHAYQASLNMGTLVGSPKVRAAQILREVENTKRATYGGAVGYLDNHGNFNSAIIIRSALVKNKIAYVRAGAGVVYDSDPMLEAQETTHKAKAVLNVLEECEKSPPTLLYEGGSSVSVLLIDNYDSFTFNLEAELKYLGCTVEVWRNNISADKALELALKLPKPRLLLLSPGPGAPKDAGCCIELIKKAAGKIPILGVCLGHQAIIEAFGGTVGHAAQVMHGKSALIKHKQDNIFINMPNPMAVGRYHSLAGIKLSKDLESIAECDQTNMAVKHKTHKICGVQFHPESILTPEGPILLKSILKWSQDE